MMYSLGNLHFPCLYIATRQGMNTGAGMVKFDSPVQVATVVADTEVHESGVHVQPYYGQPKYQVRWCTVGYSCCFFQFGMC